MYFVLVYFIYYICRDLSYFTDLWQTAVWQYVIDSQFTVCDRFQFHCRWKFTVSLFLKDCHFSKYAQILVSLYSIYTDWLCCCWCCVNMQTPTDSSTASSTWSAVLQHLAGLRQPSIQRHAAMLVSIMLAFMLWASTHQHISVYKWRGGNLLLELWEKQGCNYTAEYCK